MTRQTRAALSNRLLRFGADRSIETREMERRVAGLDPSSPGYRGMTVALAAARAWEASLLWVAWRLRPRTAVEF